MSAKLTSGGPDDRWGRARTAAAMARRSLSQDVRMSWRHVWLNRVAGSSAMPRMGRYVLYRAHGLPMRTPNVFSGCVFRGSEPVSIGAGTFVNHSCVFEANAPIEIGRDSHIAMEVMFVTSDHDMQSDGGFAYYASYRGIKVGDRCWLGARVTVLPGVTIGDDVVVAAGAVVTSDCAPGGLYAGLPAKRIRDLDPAERAGATSSGQH